jgi:hypothetical protein
MELYLQFPLFAIMAYSVTVVPTLPRVYVMLFASVSCYVTSLVSDLCVERRLSEIDNNQTKVSLVSYNLDPITKFNRNLPCNFGD